MKFNKIGNNLIAVLNDGTTLTSNSCTDEMYEELLQAKTDNEVKEILVPNFMAKVEEIQEKMDIMEEIKSSKLLTFFGNSIYLKSVSELTLPYDLAERIYKAEKEQDEELLTTYKNFWTLCCLNPDSRARTNLFWFLTKYGMTISKSGLFIAYRKLVVKNKGNQESEGYNAIVSKEYLRIKYKAKKSPSKHNLYELEDGTLKAYPREGFGSMIRKLLTDSTNLGNLEKLYQGLSKPQATTYTDQYSKTMEIRVGVPVTMPREDCDAEQDNTCSRGLHVAGKEWLLKNNHFGEVGAMVLVNPADVVAVPPSDDYGKMRTCCYYPVRILDSSWEKEDVGYSNGFEDDFMEQIAYNGTFNTEESFKYTLDIPVMPEISRNKILKRLGEISKSLKKVQL